MDKLTAMQVWAEKNAREFWTKARRVYGQGIGEMPAIKMNKRLTSTAGRAFLEREYIDLSVYLLGNNTDQFRKEIIPHELCHFIAYRLFGDQGHGKAWYNVMAKMCVDGGRCHKMITKSQAERMKAK